MIINIDKKIFLKDNKDNVFIYNAWTGQLLVVFVIIISFIFVLYNVIKSVMMVRWWSVPSCQTDESLSSSHYVCVFMWALRPILALHWRPRNATCDCVNQNGQEIRLCLPFAVCVSAWQLWSDCLQTTWLHRSRSAATECEKQQWFRMSRCWCQQISGLTFKLSV